MTTNKSSHTARVWMRRLAASLVGLTLVLMVAAGVYSRGTNKHSATVNSDHIDLSSTFVNEPTAADQKNRKGRETAPPAPPTEDMQPPSPPQPPSAPQDPQPPSPPSQNMQPASPPSQNMQPASPPSENIQPPSSPPNGQPPSPPSRTQPPPPPPIAPATTQDKKSGESSQDKKVVVVKGELIEAPQPEYPDEAKKQKIEGTVAVTITIGEEGKVISARATSGPSVLHEASVAAAFKARFKPSTADGKPVKVTGTMTYNFKLD